MNGLKERRIKAGLTQQEVGDRVGVGTSTVGMWESGANQPRASTLISLAKLFGCTVDELLGDEAEVTKGE